MTTNVSMGLRFSAQAIAGLAILFFVSWRLTLVMLAVVPAVVIAAVVFGRKLRSLGKEYQDALASASDVAEETLGEIRTVRAFNMEYKETSRYSDAITASYGVGFQQAVAYGLFAGVIGAASYGAIVLVLWYGGKQVVDGDLKSGTLVEFTLLTVFIAAAVGGMSGTLVRSALTMPVLLLTAAVASNTGLYGNLMTALGASTRIFQLVDRQPAMGGVVVNLDVSPAGDMQVPVPPARRAEPRSRGLIHFKVRESRLSSAPRSPAHTATCVLPGRVILVPNSPGRPSPKGCVVHGSTWGSCCLGGAKWERKEYNCVTAHAVRPLGGWVVPF